MKTKAAVLVETGTPLEITELEIPTLLPGQVLIEILYSGMCHTQLLEVNGYRGEDKFLPHCLGHEASAVVRDVGAGVQKVCENDKVVASWIKGSGANIPGTKYKWGSRIVNAGAITTFMTHAVVSENRLTKVTNGIDDIEAALMGCAIPTGAGMVFNTANIKAGDSVAIFGCGGIGSTAISAASAAGALPIIAIDTREPRLKEAKLLGATHTILANSNIVATLKDICPNGVDVCIEATGNTKVMRDALECTRSQGGKTVIAGNAKFGQELTINPQQLNQGKHILGTWGGDCYPDRDYPKFSRLIANKKMSLTTMRGTEFSLENINEAIDALATGSATRPVINMSL